MTFVDALIASGYVYDAECYVKKDSEGFIHCYQEGEDESEWDYAKMTEDYDVIFETTVVVDDTCVPNSAL